MVDRSLPVWPYLQIVETIAARITGEGADWSGPLPSESELCAEFGVARGTARRAVATLRMRGLVVTVHGLGSFAARKPRG